MIQVPMCVDKWGLRIVMDYGGNNRGMYELT